MSQQSFQPVFGDQFFHAAPGVDLPVMRWQPASGKPIQAVILALHGFNDYANAFHLAGPYFAEHGIVTIAYDQRGFGGSPRKGYWHGGDIMISDARNAISLLRRRYPETPLYLLGHSMGGAVSIGAMASADSDVLPDGLILEAPASWTRQQMGFFPRTALWISEKIMPGIRFKGDGLGRTVSDNVAVLQAMARDPKMIGPTRVDAMKGLVDLMELAHNKVSELDNLPILLLYGEKDEVIPVASHKILTERIPSENTTIISYDEGYHLLLRDMQAEIVYQDILKWIFKTK